MSNFKTTNEIVDNVRRSSDNMSFVDTIGSFIQNSEFKKGYLNFANGKETEDSYVWKALSAIANDLNEVVYSNVLNYIDSITNIDLCNIKALKSMMKFVGSDYEIFGNIDMLPIEVAQLMDVLSISRKYLLNSKKVKETLKEDLKNESVLSETLAGQQWKYKNLRNTFVISSDSYIMTKMPIVGEYALEDDYRYSYDGHRILSGKYETLPNYDYDISAIYCRRYRNGRNYTIDKCYDISSSTSIYIIRDDLKNIVCKYDENYFEDNVTEDKNSSILSIDGIYMQYVPENVIVKENYIDLSKYEAYVKSLFYSLLSGFITMRYNTKMDNVYPIYYYLKDEYYQKNSYFEELQKSNAERRAIKNKNNIPMSFDETTIVDNIDAGLDSLDNYFGAEKDLLQLEIDARARTMSFANIDSSYVSDQENCNSVEKYTRYSYYRKAKVLQYMKFIDNQYFSGNSYLSNNCIYKFNPNFYEIELSTMSNCNVVREDGFTGIISNDINFDIIDNVAETLKNVVMYVAKLREKVKLQTRKNYMKGTNNLIRYVINEFLVDYARNNRIFYKNNDMLRKIKSELSSHDIDMIDVVEYYDLTEYYNIDCNTTENALNSEYTNNKHWQDYMSIDENNKIVSLDGLEFKQDEIDKFYLSTMTLKQTLGTDNNDLYAFLCTIYDLGADTSYIDKNTGMFVTKLSTGEYSNVVYDKYLLLSNCYDLLVDYTYGSYQFDPTKTIKLQIDDFIQFVQRKLSDTYFTDMSAEYIKYNPSIQQLSSQVIAIDEKYNEILDTDKNYYEKSTIKYCYEDQSLAGKYLHDYYIGNISVYNSEMLLDKMYDVLQFTKDDGNIKMWGAIDSIEQLNISFLQIKQNLNKAKLLIKKDIRFADPDSKYIQDEIDCITNAVKEKKNERKDVLKSRIETYKSIIDNQKDTILSEAMQAKEEYKTLEQQFTDAISQYKRNGVPCFGADEMQYSRGTLISEVTIGRIEPCELTGNLEENCIAAIDWMAQETPFLLDCSETSERLPYGLADAGINAALNEILNNIEQQRKTYSKLKDSFTSINNKIQEACIEFNAPSLVSPIVYSDEEQVFDTTRDMFEYMIGFIKEQVVGKTLIIDDLANLTDNDPVVDTYNGYLDKLAQVQSAYDSFTLNYTEVRENEQLIQYFGSVSFEEQFNDNMVVKLSNYIYLTDSAVKVKLLDKIDNIYSEYYRAVQDYVDLAANMKSEISGYSYTNEYIETDIAHLQYILEDRIMTKYDLAQIQVDTETRKLQNSINQITSNISEYNDLTGYTVPDLFIREINKYNVLNNTQYINAKNKFLTYSGLSDGVVPFYNHKNITHSSRQLHHLFWNFIDREKYVKMTNKAYSAIYIDELETSKIINKIDDYIGPFGQLIDTWKHNVTDYTGYSTRYLNSNHTIQEYNGTYKVVDYDGAFYPPAVDDYKENMKICLDSMRDRATAWQMINDFQNNDKVNEDLGIYSADQFKVLANTYIGNNYSQYCVHGNFLDVLNKYIQLNSVAVYNQSGIKNAVMTSTKTNFTTYLKENLNRTFFEEYYYPLNLSEQQYDYIISQLECPEISAKIKDITDDHLEEDVWDIYQYGMDAYDNMYTLYKKYDEISATYKTASYKQKQNTLGEMWIRLKNHPISFPMLNSSKYSDLNVVQYSTINNYLHDKVDDIRHYCYGFNFSENKRMICMSCKNNEVEGNYFKGKYAYSLQIVGLVDQKYDSNIRRNVLEVHNPNDIPDDIIRCPFLKQLEEPKNSSGTYGYKFIGAFPTKTYAICLMYAKDNYILDEDGDIQAALDDCPQLAIVKITNETSNAEINSVATSDFNLNYYEVDNDEIVANYNNVTKTYSVAFLAKIKDANSNDYLDIVVTPVCGNISLSSNTDGGTINDPQAKEMSSHDIFNQNIVMLNMKFTSGNEFKLASKQNYNTNADMSYLPLYPGVSATANLDQTNILSDYYCIELLGKSKDLSYEINAINPYVDTDIDFNDIYANKIFGRVYEYDSEEEGNVSSLIYQTAKEKYNPLLLERYSMFQYDQENDVSSFIWSINASEVPYNKMEDLNIVILNTASHGNNPYYACTLRDFLSSSNKSSKISGYKYACYNDEDDGVQEYVVSSSIFNKNSQCRAVGTCDYSNPLDASNNRINGITSIRGRYDEETKHIDLLFDVSNDKESELYIPADNVKAFIFNPSYLEAFNYYHMFDVYGLIYLNLLDKYLIDQVHDQWYITYDNTRAKIGPYYFDNKGRVSMLSDVRLSDYSNLSDVYVLKNYDRLEYKYDEQMIFDISSDMYYYPSLNLKYPHTFGTYINSLNFDKLLHDGLFYKNMFNGTNYYSFRIDDPKYIADKIGSVSLNVVQTDNETYRAYEDYLEDYVPEKYDYADARNFEYIHMAVIESELSDFPISGYAEDEKDGYVISSIQLSNYTYVSEVIDELGFGSGCLSTAFCARLGEKDTSDKRYSKLTTDIGRKQIDLSKILTLYVNYQKMDDGTLTLYFNYMNYLNSPFIKIENGKVKPDVIDGTFLKLAAGEEGTLDVLCQLKYYNIETIYGYTNLKLVQYKIHNISDEKPKFIIHKVSEIEKNQYLDDGYENSVDLTILDGEWSKGTFEKIDGKYYINVIATIESSGCDLFTTNRFDMMYTSSKFKFIDNTDHNVAINSSKPGVLSIETANANVNRVVLRFQVLNAEPILETTTYDFTISYSEFYSKDFILIANVNVKNGKIKIVKD